MLPCVPDDIEEFWGEIRPPREPATPSQRDSLREALQRIVGPTPREASFEEHGGINLDPSIPPEFNPQEEANDAGLRAVEREAARRAFQPPQESRRLPSGDPLRPRSPRELGEGGMDLDYRSTPNNSLRRAQEEFVESNPQEAMSVALTNLEEAARRANPGAPQEARRRRGVSLADTNPRPLRDSFEQLRRATGDAEVSGRGRDPRLTELTHALAVLGFPSRVSLTLDGAGSRSLTITPEAGSAAYLDGLDIVISRDA